MSYGFFQRSTPSVSRSAWQSERCRLADQALEILLRDLTLYTRGGSLWEGGVHVHRLVTVKVNISRGTVCMGTVDYQTASVREGRMMLSPAYRSYPTTCTWIPSLNLHFHVGRPSTRARIFEPDSTLYSTPLERKTFRFAAVEKSRASTG